MNCQKFLPLIFGPTLVLLLLVACGGPQTTPAPIATTVTSVPSTPTPVHVLPTSTLIPPTATTIPPTATPIPPTPTPTSNPNTGAVKVIIKNLSSVSIKTQVLYLAPSSSEGINFMHPKSVTDISSEGTATFQDVPPGEYGVMIADKDWLDQVQKGTGFSILRGFGQVGDGPNAETAKQLIVTVVAGKTVTVEGYSYLRK